MNYNYQRFGVWSGIGFFMLFWIALVIFMGFLPPPSPTLTGQEILASYAEHLFGLRFALWLAFLGTMLLVPWSAVIAMQMARIEGRYPMLAVTSFGAGVANAVAFYLPFVFWAAAAYRMDRMPELVQLMSDLAWLEFVMLYAPFAVQTATVAVVGLTDKSATPTFPRWFCFLSFWTVLLVVPGGFAVFFQSGPFAWNGLLAFWTPVVIFCIYFLTLVALLFKAINRQEAAAAGGGDMA